MKRGQGVQAQIDHIHAARPGAVEIASERQVLGPRIDRTNTLRLLP